MKATGKIFACHLTIDTTKMMVQYLGLCSVPWVLGPWVLYG